MEEVGGGGGGGVVVELGRVGMGGWLNFSSDHVEPIKADHGTQSPPPTSSTFFVLSLFPPRVLAFIHLLVAPPPPRERERAVLFLGSCPLFPFARPRPLSSRTRPKPPPPPSSPLRAGAPRASTAFQPPSSSSRHVRSLALRQLVGFFRVTRRCNLFGRGREAPAEVVDGASRGLGRR